MIRRPWLILLFLSVPALLLIYLDNQKVQPTSDYVPPLGYVCYRAAKPLVIDGKVDEAAWEAAPWSDPFVDIEGSKKPLPQFKTRMKMLWDDQYLYIAAELEEPHIWATLTKHDSVIFHDPDFEVFIDPDGDNHLYAELELNALNTTWDLLLSKPYKDGGRAINDWEIKGLRTAVHLKGSINDPSNSDQGWCVEIAWPWSSLKELTARTTPPKDGDQWRINFSRVQWDFDIENGKYRKVPKRPEHNWVWSPQGVIDMHRPETWGYLQFSTGEPEAAKYEPDPAGPARHYLQKVYYAQRAYREKHKQWARSVQELGLANWKAFGIAEKPSIERSATDYDCSVVVQDGDGKAKRWHIRGDSLVWEQE